MDLGFFVAASDIKRACNTYFYDSCSLSYRDRDSCFDFNTLYGAY